MNPIASAVLIVLGILILLASVGVISTGFWDVILWLFAVGFGTVGLLSLIRDFPRGLVSLTIGVTLFLKLLGIIEMGFWTFVGVVAGSWLIQLGLYGFARRRRYWW